MSDHIAWHKGPAEQVWHDTHSEAVFGRVVFRGVYCPLPEDDERFARLAERRKWQGQ